MADFNRQMISLAACEARALIKRLHGTLSDDEFDKDAHDRLRAIEALADAVDGLLTECESLEDALNNVGRNP